LSDDPKPSAEQHSFDLRSRAVSRSDPHHKAAKRVKSSDRPLLIAQNSIEDADSIANAPERQVHVSTDTQPTVALEQPPNDITALMQDEIHRLQTELRRVQDANREISDKNKQFAARKRIPDSVVAPKPFLGNTK
jgi:hypothetical protein